MTASQSCKTAHRARCLSTSHGRTRSDIQLSSQIVREFTAFDLIHHSRMSRFTIGQIAGSPRLQSHTSSAALKSP
jgi:hypothetical protein